MKSKVDKLNVDKLVPVPVYLRKLNNIVKKRMLLKAVYNGKIKNVEEKKPDITKFATNAYLNAKINKVKDEIPNITNFATTTFLTVVERTC